MSKHTEQVTTQSFVRDKNLNHLITFTWCFIFEIDAKSHLF